MGVEGQPVKLMASAGEVDLCVAYAGKGGAW